MTVEQIVAAWNAREDRVRSLRFKFTDETILARKKVTVLHRQRDVVIEGVRLRHECTGESWLLEVDRPTEEHFVTIDDGERNISFFGRPEASNRVHALGFLNTKSGHERFDSEAHSNSVWPIFHTFRIRQPGFLPAEAAGWRLTRSTGTMDGHDCRIVEEAWSTEHGHLYRVWVDPARDFIALRKEQGTGTTVRSLLDIEYAHDPSGEWVPTRWTDNFYGEDDRGRPVLAYTANLEVTDYALNAPIGDDAFEFEFPPGTEVMDHSGGTQTSHLVTDSGTRPITLEERTRGARYSDYLTTDSGEALLPPGEGVFHWIWLAVVGAVAVLGWMMMKRR